MNPITGTVVDPQLRHTFTDRLNVTGIIGSEPLNPGLDTRSCQNIAQAIKPFGKGFGLADFNHGLNVAAWLRRVNGGMRDA